MKPNDQQQKSVFDKNDIQSLLLDIEQNRKVSTLPTQQPMKGGADPAAFQNLLNRVQNRPNG